VSVVIPTRNRRALLHAHGLRSALGQIGVALEVIVVDDGSTDDTVESVASHGDPRVRVLPNEHARGISGARNTGIAAARGEWLAFLDDDDLWAPDKLREQLAALGGERGWAFSGVVVIDERCRPMYALPLPEAATLERRLMQGGAVPAGSSNVVVSAALLRELGGFDETLRYTEDWDLWIRLARTSPPVVCGDLHVATLEHEQRSAFGGGWTVVREAERLLGRYGSVGRGQLLSVAEYVAFEQHRGGFHWRAAWLYLRAAVTFRSLGNVPAALGALGGDRGLRAASAFLRALRGSSHLTSRRVPVEEPPSWLAAVRRDMPERA
jgi:hypothetical protein